MLTTPPSPPLGPDPEPLGTRSDRTRDGGLGDPGALRVGSIGFELECRRLERRARRLEKVLAALHERQEQLGEDTPQGLRAAIADFGQELSEVRHDLRGGDVTHRGEHFVTTA